MIPGPGIPRGKGANLDRALHRRDELTLSSRCPFCGRRCLRHFGHHWQCQACEREWTGHKLPDVPDPLAGIRALVARAKNVYPVSGKETIHDHR